MVSSGGAVNQPQLTLEPFHTPKKVTNISQWLTAFNTFVSIYSVKCSQDAPKLMKYCEVVRDLANKSGDWIFYDEQFRYLRQSSHELYPLDQIHWELWLRAITNFRAKSPVVIGQPCGGDFQPPLSPFLGELGYFIQGGTAEVANTSTCASSAVRNIPPPSAKTKTPNRKQIPLSPEHQFQLSLRGNSLITPVRVDRFEQLLAGYDRTLKQYLINGFLFGFRRVL